jgi:dynein heavy chain
MFVSQSGVDGPIPYKALRYLTGECNYGGRVTDDWDRRTLNSILNKYFDPAVHQPAYSLSVSGNYVVPPQGAYQDYLEFIRALPINSQPEVFGMHSNADITKDQQETSKMLESILNTEGSGGGGGSGGSERDAVLTELATGILNKLPPPFDLEVVAHNYPVLYSESMNTILVQECGRYNRLTDGIRSSLINLRKAIVGEVVMSADIEAVANDVYTSYTPALWMRVSYPSLKPLGSYVQDLLDRLAFLSKWVKEGQPAVAWVSGIYFTQSFFTGAKQNYARNHNIAIDEIVFDFFYPFEHEDTKVEEGPADGVYIRGLYMEGAKWDPETKMIAESDPKVLYTKAPIIWLKPCRKRDLVDYPHYICPVYRTAARRGMLSTTGHSTNFVMSVRMPTDKPPDLWIQRGVAMLTQLSD